MDLVITAAQIGGLVGIGLGTAVVSAILTIIAIAIGFAVLCALAWSLYYFSAALIDAFSSDDSPSNPQAGV